ncbi:MAG: hypothetical protein DYH17_14000 [Xanthomonadales bacterium PRO6]|nr:hypothetical protein [Xanthomonadales bacterium PRO6]
MIEDFEAHVGAANASGMGTSLACLEGRVVPIEGEGIAVKEAFVGSDGVGRYWLHRCGEVLKPPETA